MNDDLARFPTPKEAFRQPRRPAHVSAAFEPVTNVPIPPQQVRHKQSHAPPAGPVEYHSSPSTPDGHAYRSKESYRSFSGPNPTVGQSGNSMHRSMAPAMPQYGNSTSYDAAAPLPPPAAPSNQVNIPSGSPSSGRGMYMQQSRPIQPEYRPHSHPTAYPDAHTNSQESLPRVQRRPVRTNEFIDPAATSATELPSVKAPKSGLESNDLRTLFDEVDRHKRGYLTERELSKALVNGDYTLFDAHTVRLMMKMFDRDGDGAIYFAEFGQLWKYLHDWRQVFDRFDINRSDSISFEEFCRALAAFGYSLSSSCVRFLFNAGSKLNRQGQREMSFDLFVQSCISIKSITDTFKRYDTDRDGYITMGFEDFLMETTKLH